jgi:hypothetical protein
MSFLFEMSGFALQLQFLMVFTCTWSTQDDLHTSSKHHKDRHSPAYRQTSSLK